MINDNAFALHLNSDLTSLETNKHIKYIKNVLIIYLLVINLFLRNSIRFTKKKLRIELKKVNFLNCSMIIITNICILKLKY